MKNRKRKKLFGFVKFMKHHKLIAGALTIMICVISGLLITLAVERASDQRQNTMEIADTKVVLNEHGFDKQTADAKKPVVEKTDITKQVTVDNKGETPVFVRAKVIPIFGKSGAPDAASSTNEREAMLAENTLLPLVMTDDATATGSFDVVLKGKTGNWTKADRDGYYYYTMPLAAGTGTTDLFNKVDLPMSNIGYLDEYKKNFYFNIEVKVEAVTIYKDGTTPAFIDAWNWRDTSSLTANDKKIYDTLTNESK